VTPSEHGIYHCVARNDLNVTKGFFIVDGSCYLHIIIIYIVIYVIISFI